MPQTTPRTVESDVCIVGGGITAAMVAAKLAYEREAEIVVLEAGDRSVPLDQRFTRRRRYLDYGDNPWLRDHIEDQTARGVISRSMVLGGQAMHWGGTTPRFSPEDFRLRSLFGVAVDWPLEYEELDPFYQEAEARMGVAGEQGPEELDPRAEPYPMPAMPLSWSLQRLREWGESAGIPFWSNPVAKTTVPYDGRNVCQRCDTCNICPTGAKYTPDFTWNRLLDAGRVDLRTRTLVRRLHLEDGSNRIAYAEAADRDSPEDPLHVRASTFVLAAGYCWSPHLLLLSGGDRFPDGLANSSGLVGAFMCGHRSVSTYVELPRQLYPGEFSSHSLLSKRFQRPDRREPYMRHDLRIWNSTFGRRPRLRNDEGDLLLGDEVMADWRDRTDDTGTARLRSYYDVIPDRNSRLTLDPGMTNRWGDPLPRIEFRDAPVSAELRGRTEERIRALHRRMADAGDGTVMATYVDDLQDHPAGGCRMGTDPDESVVDPWGRSHDHENLFVVGAPTMPTAGCNNGTLTFSALSLRSAVEIGREFPERASRR